MLKIFLDTKTKKIALLALILTLGLSFNFVKADNAVDQLNADKAERQKKLQEINKQITKYQEQIATTKKASNSLKNEIFIYDKQIASTELQIQARQTQIEDTDLQINELENLIAKKIQDIERNKQVLAELIVQLNQYDDSYFINTALSSKNISEFLDQVQYTQNFQGKIYDLLQKIKDLKAKLEADQNDLKIQLTKLQELKNQLEAAKDSLLAQREQKQSLLYQTRGLEANYQKLLSSSKKEEQDLQQEINDLDAKIRTKLGNKSTPAAKGVLAWPMDGILTQKYGNTGFTALGYTFHNGIDVAAPAAQPIYAVYDGEVIYTDHSDASYGNWVAIKHDISTKSGSNQIITLYAHFRSFIAKVGQKVRQGDLIGYEGNTGNTTKKLYGPERGYHIHFGVYDAEGFGVSDGKYQNIYGPYKIPYGYTYNPLDFLN
jgi:murein DD-endopeptidase MepM/ murein hydrolase activator NlpD